MAETRQGLLPTGCPRTIVSGAQEIGKIYLCRVGHANEVSMTVSRHYCCCRDNQDFTCHDWLDFFFFMKIAGKKFPHSFIKEVHDGDYPYEET